LYRSFGFVSTTIDMASRFTKVNMAQGTAALVVDTQFCAPHAAPWPRCPASGFGTIWPLPRALYGLCVIINCLYQLILQ
jgi:hypothetical protein